MAKLKAPLMSLGASQKLGGALVFFNWKGLDVVREYVIPANPKTGPQNTQRGYVTECVTAIHAAQALAVDPMNPVDIAAMNLWASIYATPRTWFNQIVKNNCDQKVATKHGCIYRAGLVTPGVGAITLHLEFTKITGANNVTAGVWRYGTSKTALIYSVVAVVAADAIDNVIPALTAGVKYYFQFRPTAHADYVGAYSGIMYGTPT